MSEQGGIFCTGEDMKRIVAEFGKNAIELGKRRDKACLKACEGFTLEELESLPEQRLLHLWRGV